MPQTVPETLIKFIAKKRNVFEMMELNRKMMETNSAIVHKNVT
jgi:hypothetical protein